MDSIGPFHSRALIYLIAIMPYMLFAKIFMPVLEAAGLLLSGVLLTIGFVFVSELLWNIKPSSCYLLSPDGISKTNESSRTLTRFASIPSAVLVIQSILGSSVCIFATLYSEPAIELTTRAFILAIGLDMVLSGIWFLTQMSSGSNRFDGIVEVLTGQSDPYGNPDPIPSQMFDLAFVPHGFGYFRLYISAQSSYKESIVIDGKSMQTLQHDLKTIHREQSTAL